MGCVPAVLGVVCIVIYNGHQKKCIVGCDSSTHFTLTSKLIQNAWARGDVEDPVWGLGGVGQRYVKRLWLG